MRPDRPTTESDGIRRLQRPSSSAVQLMSRSFSPPAHQHTPIPRGHSMPPSPPLAAATSSRASKASIARHIMNGCTSAVRNAQAPRLSLQSQRVHRAVKVLETLQSSESAQAGGATSTSHEHKNTLPRRCGGPSSTAGGFTAGRQRMCGPAAPTRWACAQTTTDTAGLIKGDLTFQSGHVQGVPKRDSLYKTL